jgi:outer membrane protein assembly factor BamE (lipoprotein component of BamABCDE complex)
MDGEPARGMLMLRIRTARQLARVLLPLGICLAATACSGVVDHRGYRADRRDLEQIQPGISTEQDVLAIMGTPTTRGTFDEKVWYYVGSETETLAFMEADLLDRKIIEIRFDDDGYVFSVNEYGPEIAREVDPVDRETPTRGNRMTLIEQFLGNLGRFNR